MSSAGQQLVAGRIPGEQIAGFVDTTDSGTFTTTETEVMSVAAPVVDGRIYRVRFFGAFEADAAPTNIRVRIRLTSTTGSQLAGEFLQIWHSSSGGVPIGLEAEFPASSTGNQVFVVSGQRTSGTGVVKRSSSSVQPALLYVDYIRG